MTEQQLRLGAHSSGPTGVGYSCAPHPGFLKSTLLPVAALADSGQGEKSPFLFKPGNQSELLELEGDIWAILPLNFTFWGVKFYFTLELFCSCAKVCVCFRSLPSLSLWRGEKDNRRAREEEKYLHLLLQDSVLLIMKTL